MKSRGARQIPALRMVCIVVIVRPGLFHPVPLQFNDSAGDMVIEAVCGLSGKASAPRQFAPSTNIEFRIPGKEKAGLLRRSGTAHVLTGLWPRTKSCPRVARIWARETRVLGRNFRLENSC